MTVRRKTTVMPSSRHTTNAYDLADEFADLVTKLWDAWEPDAVVLDRETPMFADGSKVHPVNHVGKYFRCRGPLNAPRSPQGRPPICQAGGSSRGQDFAARWADTIITDAGSVEAMKDYRDGVRRRARAAGRDPDSIKVLFLAYPLVDTTMDAAQERRRLMREDANRHLDLALSTMSRLTNIDFSRFDPDQPIPELFTDGHQSSLAKWIGKTPREVAISQSTKAGIDFTGTIDHVAGMMQEIMEEVGGDGFLFFNGAFDRRYIMEVCDGLVPELQRRGLTRTRYAHKHLKDNLLEF
jgi:alkanesulfonate monooxygenase SsuD/methylene tetrahydromethanopterin reductase-like flavin-dependent oxidoreductase (luciferase family)